MIYIIRAVEIITRKSYLIFLKWRPPMELMCINENDIERIFFQENWLSVISNKDVVSRNIYSILNQVGEVKHANIDVVCNNLIELQSSNKTRLFVRTKANLKLSVKFFEKDQLFTYDLIGAECLSGYYSKNIAFDEKMVVSEIVIMKSNGRSKLLDFIKEKKFNFSDLVNIRSIKESVNWLAAQDLQLKESPVIHYYKKAS